MATSRLQASAKQIINVSRICVVVFGLLMGILAVLLNVAGVSLGWVYLAMGVLIGSAVVPIAACLMWSKANWWGAVSGAFIGQASGIVMWLVRPKIIVPTCIYLAPYVYIPYTFKIGSVTLSPGTYVNSVVTLY